MYEHNDTIKTEISLHFVPYLIQFSNVVSAWVKCQCWYTIRKV